MSGVYPMNDELEAIRSEMLDLISGTATIDDIAQVAGAIRVLAWHIDQLWERLKSYPARDPNHHLG